MDSVWLTPKDVATLQGIPGTDRGVRKWAEKNLAITRTRVRGKGIEISLSSLPEAAQSDYWSRKDANPNHKAVVIGHPIQEGMPLPALSPSVPAATGTGGVTDDRASLDRKTIVGMIMDTHSTPCDKSRAELAYQRLRMIEPLIDKTINGRSDIERHAKSVGTTAGTLYRFLKLWKNGGVQALGGAVRKDKGSYKTLIGESFDALMDGCGVPKARQTEVAKAVAQVVRGLWAQHSSGSEKQVSLLAAAHLCKLAIESGMPEGVAQAYCKRSWAVPRRFVNAERSYAVIALADRDSKGFYDLVCTNVSRSRQHLEPGDVVFGDVSPADIPVKRPDGSQGWARLIAWRDAATNAMHVTGYLADKGEGVRREHIALSFASMCEHSPWGLPKRLYLDNGSEYNWVEMISAWKSLTAFTANVFGGTWLSNDLDEVGKVWRTEPYKPRAKLIEGGFSQLLWILGWHPCFAGSDRLIKKTRALGKPIEATSLEDLKRTIAESIQFYNCTPQGGIHMNGRSPMEVVAEFQNRGFRRVVVDSDALALSFSESDYRRVQAGQVEFGGWKYYAPELLQFDRTKVQVCWARHAPDAAYVFHPHTHKFVCAATPLPVFGFADVEGAKMAKRLASQAKKVVEVMRGQCAWLEPRDLMNEFANMAGVAQVMDRARATERRIELDERGQAMAKARNAAILAAVTKADAGVVAQTLVRLNDSATAEELEARAMFG